MNDAALQSLDCVSGGDWLVVCRGPAVQRKENGSVRTVYEPEAEGLLVHVLAVAPPLMLVRIYPLGRGAVVSTAVHWGRHLFVRATESYVREYLALSGLNPDGTKVRPEKPKKEPKPARKPKPSTPDQKGVVS